MAREEEAAYEKVLSANLGRVIDWVKYGDAKNAALLTFTSAWLAAVGILLLNSEEKHVHAVVVIFLFITEILFFIGGACAVAALLPLTNPNVVLRSYRDRISNRFGLVSSTTDKLNLLFFGDIRTLEPNLFKSEALRRYRPKTGHVITEEYIADVCAQTVITSRIAQRKFLLFNCGVMTVFAALCVLLVPFSIALLRALF